MHDIVLLILTILSVVYCCDFTAWFDWPWLIADKSSMWYAICLSTVSAYIFYLCQVKLPEWIKYRKNRKLIYFFISVLEKRMEETLEILTGVQYCNQETGELLIYIEKMLQEKNIFDDGSKKYRNRIEQTIIDALYENQEDVHQEILELLSMNILDQKTMQCILDIEKIQFRQRVRYLYRNKEGEQTSIAEMQGRAISGALVYNRVVVNRDVLTDMKAYIEMLKRLSRQKEKFAG